MSLYNLYQLNQKVDFVEVASYAEAVSRATGSKPLRIRVATDEDGSPSTYDYWPNSTATDKLERIATY